VPRCEALSSNFSTEKRKRKKERKEGRNKESCQAGGKVLLVDQVGLCALLWPSTDWMRLTEAHLFFPVHPFTY
jgi:hypothetical protein